MRGRQHATYEEAGGVGNHVGLIEAAAVRDVAGNEARQLVVAGLGVAGPDMLAKEVVEVGDRGGRGPTDVLGGPARAEPLVARPGLCAVELVRW